MPTRVLMVLGGVGLGNATRAHAILGQLQRQGAEVDLATSGRALDYFAHVEAPIRRLFALPAVHYGRSEGGLRAWGLPATLLRFLVSGVRAARRLKTILRERRYDVIVIDSCYNLALLGHSIPVVSINNSDRLFAHRQYLRSATLGAWIHFYCVEFWDFLFQKWIPDLVLSPWPVAEPRSPGIQGIGLIVRPTSQNQPRAKDSVLVMGSGSGLAKFEVGSLDTYAKLLLFSVQNHQPTRFDALEHIPSSHVVVINAGFSSLSEALVWGHHILALPLKNHAEQHIVCAFLEARGWIQVTQDPNVEGKVKSLLQQRQSQPRPQFLHEGAQEACHWILKAADKALAPTEYPYPENAKAHLFPLAQSPRTIPDERPSEI